MSIEVYRDAWGIPHLRAGDARELAWAQGRETARDRAWQLEVERHRAAGTSAAFLGADAVPWDRFARQARLADTARRCAARLDPETAAWVAAYVAGVNAGLPEGAARAPEFAAAGVMPGRWEPWTPLALWLSAHILFGSAFPAKLWREEVARRLGEDAVALFAADSPRAAGSNGWLLTGERTATGAPLVAGDPHRFLEDPGGYQQIHLACPEFDVVGLAVPGVPGIAHFGHTGPVAWGITNALADTADLYRERLRRDPSGAVSALGPDGWRPASAHRETIEVAGGEPVVVEVVETDRGPVVCDGPEPLSLRQPARVTGDLGFAALLALLRARSVADVDRALDAWAEPVNVVLAADREGGVLHRVAGRVPARDARARLRVVPAWEERYAWRGWEPAPRAAVRDGLAVMANEAGLAGGLGVEFAAPHRAGRIRALLDVPRRWRAGDLAEVHTDVLLPSAERLSAVLDGLADLSPAAEGLRKRLARWDRRMAADSADAAAFAAVRAAAVRHLAAGDRFAALAGAAAAYPELFRPWLDVTTRVALAWERLLTPDAARAALEEVAAGPPVVPWGERNRLAFWRALPGAAPAGAWEGAALSGDADCVLSVTALPGLTRGPAARWVWDLARRDDSRWVVPLGASGVPGDPHHHDQFPAWLAGGLLPVVTDWRRLAMTEFAHRVPGFGTVRVTPLDAGDPRHVALVHGWVTQERARFWGMTGLSRDDVRAVYAHMATLDTHHAHLVYRDGEPAALVQTYDPAADRVSECYDADPADIGLHLLIAPAAGAAEPGFTGRLLSGVVAFLFADPARRRVVAEPDARNEKAIRRLARTGFRAGPEVTLPEVDLPEVYLPAKRARLMFLPRPAAGAGPDADPEADSGPDAGV